MPVRERGRVLASFWTLSREIGKHWSQSVIARQIQASLTSYAGLAKVRTSTSFWVRDAPCRRSAPSEILKHYGQN